MASAGEKIETLIKVQQKLLSPGGCPWDREQTHRSLVRYLLEETYEVIEAIYQQNPDQLKQELGDLLLQVIFHAQLAEKNEQFDLSSIIENITEKMVSRHPHVFGDQELKTSGEVMAIWESQKRREGKKKVLEGIPVFLPALLRAYKLQEKAARVGFDWDTALGAIEKLKEEVAELEEAVIRKQKGEIEEELGDFLFAAVNVSRFLGIMPEEALHKTNNKFLARFNYIENELDDAGICFAETDITFLDSLWDQAKKKGIK